MPTEEWLRDDLPSFAAELLSARALRETGYFDPGNVASMLRRHRERRENFGQAISGVLFVQIWDDLFRRSALDRKSISCAIG
jgi:hypothetical protein